MHRSNLSINRYGHRLRLTGRFDAHEVSEVAAELSELMQGDHDVDLDLGHVRFLDVAALRLLEASKRDLARAGRALHVSSASRTASVIVEFARRAGLVSDFALADASTELAVAA